MILKTTQFRHYVLAALLVTISALPESYALAKVDKPGEVRDLHYGMVLFDFYQKNYFTAAVNLLVGQEQKRLVNSDAESRLLLGGLYLSYGLHTEAEEIFQALIDEGASPEVRDRAWFFIGKIRYQKQLFQEAEQALNRVGDALDKSLQPEFRTLRSNLLMAREKYTDAANFLEDMFRKEKADPGDAYADANYVRYNLGVALIRAGKSEEGVKLVEKVGMLKSNDPDIKALLRMAVVWNIPMACNRASADLMISSHLMHEVYEREVPDYDAYQQRPIELQSETDEQLFAEFDLTPVPV